MAKNINIFANFDTTAVTDPEKEYYNLPQNNLPILNQITASTLIKIRGNAPINNGKLSFSTTGIDGIGYDDNTFNFDKFYFQNQTIYFTVRVKTNNNYPAKYLKNLTLGNGFENNTIDIQLKDINNTTLNATFSSDFGILSADELGGYFKGAFQYDGVLSYLYQPNLKENPTFFTDFLGQIVGDANDPNTLGVKVYEKISNFLLNSNDIDYANIDNLISNLKLIDSNVNKFSEQYPASLKRIVDFFSINRSNLKPILNKFNQNFDSQGRPSAGFGKNLGSEIKISDTLSGGDNFKPIVAKEKFSGSYSLINTDPTSAFDFRYLGSNKTFEISSFNTRWGWGLSLPKGVGDFTYLTDELDNNLVLENGFRILNEKGGISTSIIPEYYTFYNFISTTDDSNIFSFYDYKNPNSNIDVSSLSGINNCIDEIILQDIYSGTNLI